MFYFNRITDANKNHYQELVLSWLNSDYEQRGNPNNHFWHNADIIRKYFQKASALVVTNENHQLVGYMVWSMSNKVAEIVIVEVVPTYRRKGIFKQMISSLSETCKPQLLTASVLQQSEIAFKGIGWRETQAIHNRKLFYKSVTPTVKPTSTLPKKGLVLALSTRFDYETPDRVDYYVIARDPSRYPMKYYPIQIDGQHQLKTPVLADFHYEDYIGVFNDGEFISSNKAKYLFSNPTTVCESLLFIHQIEAKCSKLADVLKTVKKYDDIKRARTESIDETKSVKSPRRYQPELKNIPETPEPTTSPTKDKQLESSSPSFARNPILQSSPVRAAHTRRQPDFNPLLSVIEESEPPSPKR